MAGTYTNLLFHIVFSTKRRTGLITPELEPDLYAYIGGVIRNQGGKLLDAGGMSDHVHLLLKSKPNVALSDLVRDIKANSSKWINESKWKIRKFGWQDGFAAFTVSESQVEIVSKYIQSQKIHHRRRDFKAELLFLLKKNHCEFDEALLWR
jgi:putative transposase